MAVLGGDLEHGAVGRKVGDHAHAGGIAGEQRAGEGIDVVVGDRGHPSIISTLKSGPNRALRLSAVPHRAHSSEWVTNRQCVIAKKYAPITGPRGGRWPGAGGGVPGGSGPYSGWNR